MARTLAIETRAVVQGVPAAEATAFLPVEVVEETHDGAAARGAGRADAAGRGVDRQ